MIQTILKRLSKDDVHFVATLVDRYEDYISKGERAYDAATHALMSIR